MAHFYMGRTMTPAQKIQLRLSEVRQRLNEVAALEGEAFTDEIRAEAETLQAEYRDLEVRHRSAMIAEPEGETREVAPDTELRERIELRSRARIGGFLMARLQGRLLTGAEAELAAAAGCGNGGIPIEMWDRPQRPEHRVVTDAPGTVGINLDPIRPQIFAKSVVPRLGVSMPRIESGTYASATISSALSAAALAKSADAAATAAGFTVSTSAPKRISARMEVAIEDIASVGTANFESALRENLALALVDELDRQCLTGDGTAPNLRGIFEALADPATPGASVAAFDDFVAAFANGVDGLWASKMSEISIVTGAATYALSARSFRDGTDDRGEMTFADYAMMKYGGMSWWTNRRMPAAAANVQSAILYRKGMSEFENADGGIRTATIPIWNEIEIDDIYTLSARGQRAFTMHILAGDIVVQQPDAYREIAFRVA